jgi:hypothetical protein
MAGSLGWHPEVFAERPSVGRHIGEIRQSSVGALFRVYRRIRRMRYKLERYPVFNRNCSKIRTACAAGMGTARYETSLLRQRQVLDKKSPT